MIRFHARQVAMFLAVGVAWSLAAGEGPPAAAEERPNIVFIFADDQCFDTLAASGNPEVETPNLDRLAQRGTRYSHCYNMGSWSGAVCVASRTMLNTGRMLWDANAIYGASERERAAGRWWGEYMKAAGYRTYMTGKWHCRASAEKTFDVVADVRGGMPRQTPAGYNRPQPDGRDPWSPSDPQFGGFWAGGTHWSEVVGNHAVRFLSEATEQPQPFFMYLAFNAPHDPRQSPAEFVQKYPADQILVPKNFLPKYPFAEAIGCGPGLRDEKLAPFPRTERQVQVHRQEYYAIISHMDQQIGRILDAVEASGQADRTWIFFTADHGLAVGQHGLMGKQNMYDHSLRVPCLVAGPGVAAGAVQDQPVYLQDIMPTTLELAGVKKPQHVQFHSLLPHLGTTKPSPYEAIYGAYLQLQRCVRTDRYKLILYPKAQAVRLYDVQADPLEQHDLHDQPVAEQVLGPLYAQLRSLQKSLGDPLDLDASFPELAKLAVD